MRIILIILVVIQSLMAFSQNKTVKYDKDYYYQRGVRHQNTGLILLGAGSLMALGGYRWFNQTSLWDNEWGGPVILMIAGGGVVASSVPFFILGAKNKGISKGMTGIKAGSSYLYDIDRPMISVCVFVSFPIHSKLNIRQSNTPFKNRYAIEK